MKISEKQKMCGSCDGRIPLEAHVCPYCTAEQGSSALHHQSIQASLSSLYAPPYTTTRTTAKSTKPQEPMAEKRYQHTTPLGVPNIQLDQPQEPLATEGKSSFWPLMLLSIGANLLILGLLQLFFSEGGYLTLQWDSSYWFVYFLAALPLCYLGYKKASQLG